MSNNPNEQFWWYKGYQLTEEDIRRSMENSDSCKGAARFLGIGYKTWKRYANKFKDLDLNKKLFDIQREKSLNTKKEVIVINPKTPKGRNLKTLLVENQRPTKVRLAKLKQLLIDRGVFKHKCNRCDYKLQRQEDGKIPLTLHFRNGIKSDWRKENLEFVCYNCSFLYCLDFFKESLLDNLEATNITAEAYKKEKQKVFQLDEFYLDYMNQLGMTVEDLPQEKITPKKKDKGVGSRFIDLV